jgi:LPXTG-motif cell wall-anchored protein
MSIFDAGIIGLLYEIGPYIAFGLAGIVILVCVIVLIARKKRKKDSEGA